MRRSTDCFSAFILYPFRRKGNNLAGWCKRFQRLSKQELSALGAKSSSFAPFIYNAHNFPFPNVAAVLCILRRTFSAEIKTGGIMPVRCTGQFLQHVFGAHVSVRRIQICVHRTAVCACGTGCCFSERMRKLFRKNEKNVLRFCNKKAKEKRRLQRVKKPM